MGSRKTLGMTPGMRISEARVAVNQAAGRMTEAMYHAIKRASDPSDGIALMYVHAEMEGHRTAMNEQAAEAEQLAGGGGC